MRADRHSRHRLFAPLGDRGQKALGDARVAIVGCGALGSRSAELLGRAGVGTGRGHLRVIDRDYVEESNLQRQALFDSADADRATPKATAVAAHLKAIDPSLLCQTHVRELNAGNALELLRDVDLIIDGTDNFRARYLINDAALSLGIPWIYGGAVGSRGIVAFFDPHATPCLRCLLEDVPAFGVADSCETAGIITPLPAMVAALQVAAAMRWIVEKSFQRGVTTFDLWKGEAMQVSLGSAVPAPDCPSCGSRLFPALHDQPEEVVTLCGRNSVQVFSSISADLDSTARRFDQIGRTVRRHHDSLSADIPEGMITLFRDGRIIVEGTTDVLDAKSIIARYLGG
ncbi:MAG TPA: ThiF family adenylyltransferase [Thermoanaerobaculia bacterium]|nr:ThiF family adenylyltransferase [Thermoanaerobaculia bacterium]